MRTMRKTASSYGQMIRTKPVKDPDGALMDMSAYTVTLEISRPGVATVTRSATGQNVAAGSRLIYRIADGDFDEPGARYGVRFYALDADENLESTLGYIEVVGDGDPT